MANSLTDTPEVKELLKRAAGLDQPGGNERLKRITHRVLADVFRTIEEFEATPTEFWSAVAYLTRLGQANEGGLLVAGLGIERFLDIVMDEKERRAGLEGGTPRTIEGPLWLAGAPLVKGEARLDQDPERGTVLIMEGQVRDTVGTPVPGSVVDVWHANTKGGYSFFDPPRAPGTCGGASRPTPRGTTASAPSCRRATAARRTGRRRSCLTTWAGTGSAPRTSTSSWRRQASGS